MAERYPRHHLRPVPIEDSLCCRYMSRKLFHRQAPCSGHSHCNREIRIPFITSMAESKYMRDNRQISLIGSHGQTIWHDVAPDGHVTSTLQLGEASCIASALGITTVSDFRVADVAVGGHGAPLTSTFDMLVMRPRSGTKWRALQNIGGIGNVTFVPPLCQVDGDSTGSVAFDTGPGNVLIDAAVTLLTNGKQHFDHNGEIASRGTVNAALLQELLGNAFYERQPPKTTGRELFGVQTVTELSKRFPVDENFVATLTELTAVTIVDSYRRFAPAELSEIVVHGGGAHNAFLMSRILHHARQHLHEDIQVLTSSSLGIDGDSKEALMIALLAYLCVRGEQGNVPACTGAQRGVVLGKISPAANFGALMHGV
eukprot:TRINITY_DN441_c0_g1_i3.p1 TRINITY_DN441_c0_g1~~TRINITY_DN441_c0_g1_i3.p1  ORF type:complete len:370 (+),score=75.39 TRINITY_DN441_c0_g1_i3:195-1304(+)